MALGRKTGGRAKGTPNARTVELTDLVRGALADAGGRKYLARMAIESPAAFLTLVGKLIPRDINLAGFVEIEVDVAAILRDRKAVSGQQRVEASKEAASGR